MEYVLAGFAILIIAAFFNVKKRKARILTLTNNLAGQGYNTADCMMLWRHMGAINSTDRKVAIAEIRGGQQMVIGFEDIRGCEILKDGEIIYKKSAGRTIGGALVGGALLGGVGAIVGGLSGGSRGKERINSATLKILTNDIDNPSIQVNIFDKAMPGPQRKPFIEAAQRMADKIAIIVDQNNR
jgi:hypothetical protein